MRNLEYTHKTVYEYHPSNGKLNEISDENGFQQFGYGNMGEISSIHRVYAFPFQSLYILIDVDFKYDSWGRINKITYPFNILSTSFALASSVLS
jgi:hypothetical protein